ncbi:MAG TPA: S46 family peptidase [Candidatus Angelobacter sp.]|nr:S46 family peptidase [Candidatus Angelobacter sp.]
MSACRRLLAFCLAYLLLTTAVRADEGLWTFDNPPNKRLQQRYGFTLSQEWLDHIRLSAVRLNDGGSGAFVSPHGLLLTNHHVARRQLQNNSSATQDYLRDGFYAATPEQEMKSPDLEVNVLTSMENVTARVQDAIKGIGDAQKQLAARKEIIARIERESTQATGLRSDIVTLYHGGEYWLYRYKKYTDVRLVFAPEEQIAFFGGDPDNFSFPRYDLDVALFRVYDRGKPLETSHYLKWSANGAAEGELVFMAGHPGSTSRLDTVAQLLRRRDSSLPMQLAFLKQRIETMQRYSARGPEQARQAGSRIFGLQNSVKAVQGGYVALLDPKLIAKKQADEDGFRKQVASRPEWQPEFGGVWETIAAAESKAAMMAKKQTYRALDSQLGFLASSIVLYVAETKKPDGERLPGFHESQLESLRFRLTSPAPIYPEMEEAAMSAGLVESVTQLGNDDVWVKTVLGGRTPAALAADVIHGTKLTNPAVRKALLEGGSAAVESSTDPMIVLARKIDPLNREMFKWFEDNVSSVEQAAGEKLGKAQFLVYGKSTYPDSTFTLRLSYGTAAGYPMNGTKAPYRTTFYGLYDRAYSFGLADPFSLPARYKEGRDKLDLSTPLDFANSCDSVGGSSGSPVVNKNAELVGINFDRNLEGLGRAYVYQEETGRAIAVHSAAIIEALRKMYGAGKLADELQGRGN